MATWQEYLEKRRWPVLGEDDPVYIEGVRCLSEGARQAAKNILRRWRKGKLPVPPDEKRCSATVVVKVGPDRGAKHRCKRPIKAGGYCQAHHRLGVPTCSSGSPSKTSSGTTTS